MSKKPPRRRFSCGIILLPIIVLAFVIFGILKLGTGDVQAGFTLLVIGLSLLLIIPAGYLARFVFRGKIGAQIRGENIEHPIFSTKRFRLSLREHKRPLWFTILLYALGWIVIIIILITTIR
jgi:hypothetical protein